MARQLSSSESRPDSSIKRVVSSQVPLLHHPKSFARRAAIERGVFLMGAPPDMPLSPVPGPPTFDAERWISTPAQLPAASSLVVKHAQVSRDMNQLGFQTAGFAHHQQNRQHEVPAAVVRGMIPSPLEVASQGASQSTQTSFFPPESDKHNQRDVRSDWSRHRSSDKPPFRTQRKKQTKSVVYPQPRAINQPRPSCHATTFSSSTCVAKYYAKTARLLQCSQQGR